MIILKKKEIKTSLIYSDNIFKKYIVLKSMDLIKISFLTNKNPFSLYC